MPNAIQLPKLRRMVEQLGPEAAAEKINGLLQSKQIKPHELSLRETYEGLCGPDALRAIDASRKSGGTARHLTEAADAVSSAAFTSITGQLFVSKVKDAYETASLIGAELAETMPSTFLDGERVPGIGGLGDSADVVGEGEQFPEVGLSEEYVDFGPIKKRGFKVSVTKESIVKDRTGVLLARCGDGGRFMGLNKEKRLIDCSTGITNTYKRNGVATNTYLTSGAYINQQSNSLTAQWRCIETADLLFDGILDPTTGEPITVNGEITVIVPRALYKTAEVIFGASMVRFHDGASSTYATYAPNPVGGGRPYKVITNPYVKLRTSSATTWFYGQPKKSFVYREAWSMQSLQLGDTTQIAFDRDVVQQFRFDESGDAGVIEPRYMTKNT